ncbi:uncharacterized protein LOC134209614 [Armigeres subalbatus]|uniref:uncharacterized protein LOC134209614 n=1 Tax=Armigeres subalbatus TaxID=124917 RepID=UPI002ED0E52F
MFKDYDALPTALREILIYSTQSRCLPLVPVVKVVLALWSSEIYCTPLHRFDKRQLDDSNSSPGRTVYSILEAPAPLGPVVQEAVPSHHSRPGPVVEVSKGVFQPVISGKYSFCSSSSLPDIPSSSSSLGPIVKALSRPVPSVIKDSLSDLRFYFQNVRGLRTKVDEVFLSTSELEYDIYVFTETWLDDCIQSSQLFCSNYAVFRVDRCVTNSSRRRGGGVLIAVSKKIGSSLVTLRNGANIEQLWVKVSVRATDLFVGALYIPPDKSQDRTFMQYHIDAASEICSLRKDSDSMVLFGDFNQPRLVWKQAYSDHAFVDALQSHISMASQIMLDNMAFYGLHQRNMIRNCNERILDLVFSSDSDTTNKFTSLAAEEVVPIDRFHPPLDFCVTFQSVISFSEEIDLSARDFRRGDFDTMCGLLSNTDWIEVTRSTDVDSAVSAFNTILRNCIAQTVPLIRLPKKPAWDNSRLRALRRRRFKMLQQYCRQRCYFSKQQFDEASRIYRGYNRFLYKQYVRRKQDDLRRNPKKFWSFVNSKRQENGLPTSMYLGDGLANNLDEKCALFAEQFSSVFTNNILTAEETNAAIHTVPRDLIDLDILQVTPLMIKLALKKLKLSFCPGPDGIPSCIFKKCGPVLAEPLLYIFNQSLQQQKFPTVWNTSHMRPVFKKGDKSNVANYRGITSLSAGSKCLETIVNDVMFGSCRTYISKAQHGFYPRRSVESNLYINLHQCHGQWRTSRRNIHRYQGCI